MRPVKIILSHLFFLSLVTACNNSTALQNRPIQPNDSIPSTMNNTLSIKSGYAEVNGLHMYYEICGEGQPLVLIHGGGSTIETNFGKIMPLLAKNRQVIAMELQAHGRTADRDTPLSFVQDADDVAALLTSLHITKADILGFSNGGQTAIEIALRHPQIINKLILSSTFCNRNGVFPQFWDIFKDAKLAGMPKPLQEGFLKVTPDSAALLNMFNRDVERMQHFKGWSDAQMRSIKAPALIMNGTKDVGSVEHAAEMHRLIPNSDLAILPGVHGQYLGEVTTLVNGTWQYPYAVQLIEEFLNAPKP